MPPANEIRGTFAVTFDHRVLFTDGVFDPPNPSLIDVMPPGEAGRPARVLAFLDAGPAAHGDLAQRVTNYFRANANRAATELANETMGPLAGGLGGLGIPGL